MSNFSFGEWESLKTSFVDHGKQGRTVMQNCFLVARLASAYGAIHLHKGVGWAGLERKIPAFTTT